MPYGPEQEVFFVREDGVWRIEDPGLTSRRLAVLDISGWARPPSRFRRQMPNLTKRVRYSKHLARGPASCSNPGSLNRFDAAKKRSAVGRNSPGWRSPCATTATSATGPRARRG